MLQIILLFPMPETPCWLLGKNRRSDALESLFWLRGPSADIEDECITIKETIGETFLFQKERGLEVTVLSDAFNAGVAVG